MSIHRTWQQLLNEASDALASSLAHQISLQETTPTHRLLIESGKPAFVFADRGRFSSGFTR